MIFITAKFHIKAEHADAWPQISRGFTDACRNEAGCMWFDWYRSVEDPATYVLVEAFRDADAGAAHVGSPHFAAARRDLPPYLAETPKIISQDIANQDWDLLGELAVE